MDFAAAVNEEARDLAAAGATVVQLDEPWLRNNVEAAEALCRQGDQPRVRRHLDHDRAASVLRLRASRHGKRRLFVLRSSPTPSRSRFPSRPRSQSWISAYSRIFQKKTVILGSSTSATHAIESDETVRAASAPR